MRELFFNGMTMLCRLDLTFYAIIVVADAAAAVDVVGAKLKRIKKQ